MKRSSAALKKLQSSRKPRLFCTPWGYGVNLWRVFLNNVLYTVDPDVLYIVAIAHQKRRPNYWLRRLSLGDESAS